MTGDDDYKDMGFGSGDAKKPPTRAKPRITKAQSRKAAEQSGFMPKVVGKSSPTAHGRRRRRQAVRDKNFTVRTFCASIDDFYDIAEANDWGLGKTFESIVKNYKDTK